jgi:anti-sigma factor RsiW
MSDRRDTTISDFDLLAYADGRLDGDPERKAAVEALLARRPDMTALVTEYRAQNAALREAFPRVTDETPRRLTDMLHEQAGSRALMPALRVAAVLALMAATAFGGWYVGQRGTGGAWLQRPTMAEMARSVGSVGSVAGTRAATAEATATPQAPLAGLSESIRLDLQPPDLSAEGLRLLDRRQVDSGKGRRGVELVYADSRGERLSLLIAPRWPRGPRTVRFDEEDGVTVAHWTAGPLGFAIAGRRDRAALEQIAAAVHQAISESTSLEDQAPAASRPQASAVPLAPVVTPAKTLVSRPGAVPSVTVPRSLESGVPRVTD